MKPIQWILVVVVLVVMVFAITFVMQFLGENNKLVETVSTGDGPGSEEILVIPETKYPTQMQGYVDQERTQKYGDHDFPFVNPTAEPVTVGLNSISCSCVSVSILLASEEWKTSAGDARDRPVDRHPHTTAASLGLRGRGDAHDPGLREEAAKIKPAVTLVRTEDTKSDYALPPNAVGWIRLAWLEEQTGTQNRAAELRMKQKTRAVVHLEAHLHAVEPVQFLAQEYVDQDFTIAELQQKPKEMWFTIYSTTRPTLHPKAALLLPKNWKPEQAPITVSEPQPVPPEEWYRLREQLARQQENIPPDKRSPPPQLQCVYGFRVTLHDRSADKKYPFPFGLYRARIRVTFDDKENIDTMVCYVRGILIGDIRVAKGKDDRIDLGTFPASSGNEDFVMLYCDVPDLKLEIDQERLPSFLTASVKPDPTDKTAWKLTVSVKPNKVVGTFPSQDDDNYFDTGVYVNVVGDSSRSLRVPVVGNALR